MPIFLLQELTLGFKGKLKKMRKIRDWKKKRNELISGRNL